MIIIKGHESQVLPNQLATPQAQYAGDGAALAQGGKEVANTANQAVYIAARLGDHQAQLQAHSQSKATASDLTLEADKYFNEEWIPNYVQQNVLPKDSVAEFSKWFDARKPQLGDTSNNPYLEAAVAEAHSTVKAKTLLQAREYANKSFVQGQRDALSTQLEKDMTVALLADMNGQYDAMTDQVNRSLADIEKMRGTLLRPDEVEKEKEKFQTNFAMKRAYQTIIRDPEGFIIAQQKGDYARLDPKDQKALVDAAYAETHRRESRAQDADKIKRQQTEDFAKATEQDFYKRSVLLDNKGNRLHSTQSLLNEASQSGALGSQAPQVITYLESKLAHERSGANKFDDTFYTRTLLPNIYKGKYADEIAVLQAGADKLDSPHMDKALAQFHTYNGMVTKKISQDYSFGEELIKGTFKLPPGASIDPAGVNDAGNRALDRFNTWYTTQVQDATVKGPQTLSQIDIQSVARKIRDEEYVTLQNNLIPIIEATESSLRYKTAAEAKAAAEAGDISERELNMYLSHILSFQHLQTLSGGKTTTSNPKRVSKD